MPRVVPSPGSGGDYPAKALSLLDMQRIFFFGLARPSALG